MHVLLINDILANDHTLLLLQQILAVLFGRFSKVGRALDRLCGMMLRLPFIYISPFILNISSYSNGASLHDRNSIKKLSSSSIDYGLNLPSPRSGTGEPRVWPCTYH